MPQRYDRVLNPTNDAFRPVIDSIFGLCVWAMASTFVAVPVAAMAGLSAAGFAWITVILINLYITAIVMLFVGGEL